MIKAGKRGGPVELFLDMQGVHHRLIELFARMLAVWHQIGTGQHKTVLIAYEYMARGAVCDGAYRHAQAPRGQRLLMADGGCGTNDLIGTGVHALTGAVNKIAAPEKEEGRTDNGEAA